MVFRLIRRLVGRSGSDAAPAPAPAPDRIAAANDLVRSWRIDEAIAECGAALEASPADTELFSSWLLYSHFSPQVDAEELYARHVGYGALVSGIVAPSYRGRWRNTPEPERRLRVGYVSRNLSRHSVGYFVEPVIEHHDRARYEVYCYYTHALSDDVTGRIARAATVWRHLPDIAHDALAAIVEEDEIDVLVDLAGHTKMNSLPAFACEPAPVQMTWLGYPDTTGLSSIGYRITDGLADPPGASDALATEKLLRLPPPFLCYRPPSDVPLASRHDAEEIVFGSFNTLVKVNEPLIALWSRVLAAVPRSRLVLKAALLENGDARERLLERFAAHGVAAERIVLHPWSIDLDEHLAAYGGIDVALDTFPYNGTTTTCEALWMGVPVVTLAGEVHMSRVGASLLNAVGLPELIATHPEAYVEIAVALAQDAARRHALRNDMRARLQRSPLLDHAAFVNALESKLSLAWRDRRAQPDG
jgi:predicted O-linked N-acetylglucosamine transferase (SPINDLY family)